MDLPTVAALVMINLALQTAASFRHYRLARHRTGPGWWTLSNGLITCGFATRLIGSRFGDDITAITVSSGLFLAGVISIEVGVLRFMGQRESRAHLLLLLGLCMAGIAFSNQVHPDQRLRAAVMSVALAVALARVAQTLHRHKVPALRSTTNALIALYASTSVIFLARAVVMVIGSQAQGGLGDAAHYPVPAMVITCLVALLVTSLSTYGLISLVNQRQRAEELEANGRVAAAERPPVPIPTVADVAPRFMHPSPSGRTTVAPSGEVTQSFAPTREAQAVAVHADLGGLTTLPAPLAVASNELDIPAGIRTGLPRALADRYCDLKRIGQGGNGIVFSAHDQALHRTVVLKFMLQGTMAGELARKYFLREVKLVAGLNHLNIVHIYDTGICDDVLWYAMEYVDGIPLTAYLVKGQPIGDNAFFMSVLDQLCAALDYAHKNGLVHRDVKPDNVLVAANGTLKLLDFGLARALNDSFGELSVLTGTPNYMAPEQLDGAVVDHRADIYSLGVVLFRMVTGVLPFTEGNIFVAHATQPVPDPRIYNPELTAGIVAVIERCMAKKPSARYDNCRQVALDMRYELCGNVT